MSKPLEGREPITLFICGRTLRTCHACGQTARTSCQFDGCARPLCDTHMRKQEGQDRCAQHAPMTVNENMPRPPIRTKR